MFKTMRILALCLAMFAFASGASGQNAAVYVVHGIPGADLNIDPALPVDVEVVGAGCVLQGFTFRSIAGPLSLPAGTYNINIKPANSASPCSEATLLPASATVMAGKSYSVVAHLLEGGAPTVSAFGIDLAATPGSARVIAHHTANAPAVDITLARNNSPKSPSATLAGVTNGAQASPVFQAGNWQLTIAAAGGSPVVVDAAPLQFRPFKAYLVFAVGSLTNSTFELLLKDLDTARR